jgi:hypothetical protein
LILHNRHSIEKVRLNNFFEPAGTTGMIPYVIRVDHRNGTAVAYTQAVGFGTQQRDLSRNIYLFETPFEIFPRG